MEPKNLKDQLEGLFSGLVESADNLPSSQPSQTPSQQGPEDAALASNWTQERTESDEATALSVIGLSTKPVEHHPVCPHLGLMDDRASHLAYPEVSHRCFVVNQKLSIPLDHQSSFCFAASYHACSRFVDPPTDLPSAQSLPSVQPATKSQDSKGFLLGNIKWGLVGLTLGLVGILIFFYLFQESASPTIMTTRENVIQLTPTLAVTLSSASVVSRPTPTPKPVIQVPAPIPTATSVPGSKMMALYPEEAYIGWLGSSEDSGNHFGDSYLYAGIYEGQIYQGAFQFDLNSVPRGAPIYSAAIHMTGLREDRLAIHNDRSNAAGAWSLRLLESEIDEEWIRLGYQEISNASVLQTLQPVLSDKDLAVGQTNVFELSPTQVEILQTRITENEEAVVSFRMEGPVVGMDNLFAWDTGYGPQSRGNSVTLFLNIGPAPATPPPYKYVVVTSTPTPENVVTAAAIARQMTAEATRIGTATPAPANMATATPIPDSLIIIPTPVPENAATAQTQAEFATAVALTTGTPTPIPINAVTATPTPTSTATPLPIFFDPFISFVLITSTPTPQTVFAAATMSVQLTAAAQRVGTPTPLPTNWVTPIVVTASPAPVNAATAQVLAELATVVAFTTGTPTPTPRNMVTATSTPVFEHVPYLFTPSAGTLTATPFPDIPASLLGKILFKSDRSDDSSSQSSPPVEDDESVDVYVYDPETGDLGRLTSDWPYEVAKLRDAYSADMVYQTYTKQLLWTNIKTEFGNIPTTELAIHYYDYKYNTEKIVTKMGAGIVYDPVWSPVNNQLAFVATESGNDEIWVINYDGTDPRQLTHNTWEWDKSPSWSPDGTHIVFMSNRTGNQQLWIMNADGSDQRLLLGWDNWTSYNDYDPVWIKFLNPPPPTP